MNTQSALIKDFVKSSKYYLVNFSTDSDNDFGKILRNEELKKINIEKNEIHRSIENKNGDCLFVLDLKPKNETYIDNPIQLLLNTLDDARGIELVYPNIFKWVFNGLNIKAYALVPSGKSRSQSTISRYGGTENFIKILRHHLKNIVKMKNGISPDYNFLNLKEELKNTELSIGSINSLTGQYNIFIDLTSSYIKILKDSKYFISSNNTLNHLEMKYWAREINPDFIIEAKHIKLKNSIPLIDKIYDLYPLPVKRIMKLKHKGNYNRFLLARFLLSVHTPKDAKFMYYSVLGDEEREHISKGDCSTQWGYILNNIKRYCCPSLKELNSFIKRGDPPLSHPLEKVQAYLKGKNDKN
ncbi:MAG: hypothetical protein ACTSSP_12760 [Candidatus Asgardarchaeia archaeon]